MIYFDTDVLINAYVRQDQGKYRQSVDLIERTIEENAAGISTLSIQETLHVLGRMRVDFDGIRAAFDSLMQLEPLTYGSAELRRTFDLATRVGFRNINDCIHTAIAEAHCAELITYNRRDFNRIRNFARVDITVL